MAFVNPGDMMEKYLVACVICCKKKGHGITPVPAALWKNL